MESPSAPPRRRRVRIAGLEITRAPGVARSENPIARTVSVLGAFLVAFHELIYRQSGGEDFPFFRVISHAGSDMILMLIILVSTIALLERKRR